jgi:hypothetical protein
LEMSSSTAARHLRRDSLETRRPDKIGGWGIGTIRSSPVPRFRRRNTGRSTSSVRSSAATSSMPRKGVFFPWVAAAVRSCTTRASRGRSSCVKRECS